MPAPGSNLAMIKKKVRRLTQRISEAMLSDTELTDYINTFVIYDFPEHLRTFNLRQQFTFYTNPYQDVYPTDTASFVGATTNPLYNFQNKYISVHPPFYIAGFQASFSQSREQFFGYYPLTNSIQSIGQTGDGVTIEFSGFIQGLNTQNPQPANPPGSSASLLMNQVLFSSLDTSSNGLAMVDVPIIDTATGNPTIIGNFYATSQLPPNPPIVKLDNNFINYVTGEFKVTFNTPPGQGQQINSQTVPTIATLPQAVLYYQNQFVVRPVPDQPYRINFEVYVRPDFLMENESVPELEEWWQYIAYGAAKKIFEDNMDLENVALIMPEFKKQETLCLRRTLVQLANERVATIYTEQTQYNGGMGWGGGNGTL